MTRFFFFLLLLLLLPISVSAAVFIDAAGRQVEITESPRRIVALVPSVTEIFFAIGAGDRIVAVTDYTDYPEEARSLPSVGSYASPNLEGILSFKPDLVIATADGTPLQLFQQLTRFDVPVFAITTDSVDSSLTAIESLGRISGETAAAQQLVADVRARINTIREQLADTAPVRVLSCVMLQPLTVAGPGTFVDDILRRAGGVNVVQPGPSAYPTWNQEALLFANPDVIVVPTRPGLTNPGNYFERWPQLRAVRDKRILSVNADWIHRPGPRMILGIEALAKALHPGIRIQNQGDGR